MPRQTRRQNFDVTPEQEAEILWLRDALQAPSTKEAILRAVRVTGTLVKEVREGKALYLGAEGTGVTRLLIPELQTPAGRWRYLAERPHPWRRQAYVKGRRLLASTVWLDMHANRMSPSEVSENWGLPLEAVEEIIQYCESHRDLIRMEAEEERARLSASGASLGPPAPRR